MSDTVAEALRRGERPTFHDADDELIFDFATELYETKRVSDATFEKTLQRFGRETTVNLVGLLGYYALVAMTLNVFEMRAQGDSTLPFPE